MKTKKKAVELKELKKAMCSAGVHYRIADRVLLDLTNNSEPVAMTRAASKKIADILTKDNAATAMVYISNAGKLLVTTPEIRAQLLTSLKKARKYRHGGQN